MAAPMILSRRSFASADVAIQRCVVRHPAFVVRFVETTGVRGEDKIWARSNAWSLLWPGVVVPVRSRAMWDHRELFVQWDPGVFPGGGDVTEALARFGPSGAERIEAAVEPIVAKELSHADLGGAVLDLFGELRALGVLSKGPTARDLADAPSPKLVRVGRAIDEVLSRPGARPKLVDLCEVLACSERFARQLVREYGEIYALEGATEWRGVVRAWTIYLSGLLMTSPGATTDRIARLLGYGSSNAFCHALANAGLPTPGEMRRLVSGWA